MSRKLAINRLLTTTLLLLLIVTAACRGKHQRVVVQNEEEPAEGGPRVASTFKMSDPGAPGQLLHGVYGLESGSWRWTAGKFTFLLHPPLASAEHGATLTFAFSIPDIVMQKLGPMTLTASVGSTKLKSETYSKPGAQTFVADVPPGNLLAGETMAVDFALDKSLPAGSVDQRELGVVAISVGLEGK
jgi:hypothetical protein